MKNDSVIVTPAVKGLPGIWSTAGGMGKDWTKLWDLERTPFGSNHNPIMDLGPRSEYASYGSPYKKAKRHGKRGLNRSGHRSNPHKKN